MELLRQEAHASSSQRRTSVGDGDRGGFDPSELMSVDQCEAVAAVGDSRLAGAPMSISTGGGAMAAAASLPEKRKRGRPPRGHVKPPAAAAADEEEDVCFICFDGGSLVLCDRRNCPKAYHPACIKRDEAFFRSRAKWNCGWHICSTCEKASHYMCYTCTYSLCKGCTKGADYVCVRGNKGFCGTCMRTILLIEKFEGNKDAVQVDFDDKTSWEYLFKVYWVLLKGNLSLTLDELLKATNPWGAAQASNWGSSGNSCQDLGVFNAKRRKINTKTNILITSNSLHIEKSSGDTVTHPNGVTNWASKELLEFVAHMRNGDTSVMSEFDVQELLLEYIKINNLHDPQQKCPIVCDLRLFNMFGQARLGHIEMLNLLEAHFLIKDDISVNNTLTAGHVEAVDSQMESVWNCNSQMTMLNDKWRKIRKRTDEKGALTNSDAYATIDVHNINLIFMRRNLLENLIDDAEKFHEKVVGAIVRIRIISGDQKPDMYRLVRVVGTTKGTEPYKISTKETNVMLEILNLDKKEVIPIDGISDQEFSQLDFLLNDRGSQGYGSFFLPKSLARIMQILGQHQMSRKEECERLRQSIKFGLIKRLTVGEIQEKAIALQEVKLNDWLESEILRLNHLRDLASEKGHRKELREYVEKLELLNSPEERKRRLEEVPLVHADPTMDPSYDFDHGAGEVDQKKQDNKVKTRNSGAGRKRRASSSPGRGGDVLINCGSNTKNKAAPAEQHRDNGMFGVNSLKTLMNENETDPIDSGITDCSSQGLAGSDSYSDASEVSLALSTGTNQSVDSFEMHKIWHYQDPTGKIQGPFFMLQLRKWSSSGHFPPELRIWRVNEKPEDSILLTDALSGQCSKEQLLPLNSNLPQQEDKVASDDRKNSVENHGQSKSVDVTPVIGEHVEPSRKIELDDLNKNLEGSSEAAGINGLCSNPPSTVTLAVANSSDGHSMNVSEGLDSLKGGNVWPTQTQAGNSLSTPVSPEEQKLLHQIEEDPVTEAKSGQNNGNLNVWQNADFETRTDHGCENRSDVEDHSGQSSGQNWKPPVNSPTNDRDSNSGINSIAKSLETTEQNQVGIGFPNPPNLNLKPSNESPDGQAVENKQSVHDAGLSWSTASSLVGGSAQLHEVAGDSGGYPPSPAKLPVEEWESSLVSASSLKLREIASDHAATPASISDHLTPSSPSHPNSNTSSWHDLVNDPDEFSSLLNESVSDLLAEVEAMESLHALSCHKVVNYDLNEGCSKTDCISPIEGFSPAPEPGKGDALSSTADIHLPPQSDVIDEALDAEVRKLENSLKGDPAISPELEGDTKHSDVSVNQWDNTSADIQQAGPTTTTGWDLEITDTPWNPRSESMDTTSWGTVQTNPQLSWDGVMDWGRATTHLPPSMNPVAPPSGGILGSQPRHSGDRYNSGHRDRSYHVRDSGFGRNRHGWNNNRQPIYGGGGGSNGGGSFRAPPKGQRVCKFYESGYCKRGASCSYFHP